MQFAVDHFDCLFTGVPVPALHLLQQHGQIRRARISGPYHGGDDPGVERRRAESPPIENLETTEANRHRSMYLNTYAVKYIVLPLSKQPENSGPAGKRED